MSTDGRGTGKEYILMVLWSDRVDAITMSFFMLLLFVETILYVLADILVKRAFGFVFF